MAGLIIDVFIAWLVKLLARFHRTWGCRNWPRVEATIQGATVGGGWTFNCPTTELTFTYEFQGQSYDFTDRKPFFLTSSAKAYVERYSLAKTPMVRVNPADSAFAVLRQADQPGYDW